MVVSALYETTECTRKQREIQRKLTLLTTTAAIFITIPKSRHQVSKRCQRWRYTCKRNGAVRAADEFLQRSSFFPFFTFPFGIPWKHRLMGWDNPQSALKPVNHLDSNGLILSTQHVFRQGGSCLSNFLDFLDRQVTSSRPVHRQCRYWR